VVVLALSQLLAPFATEARQVAKVSHFVPALRPATGHFTEVIMSTDTLMLTISHQYGSGGSQIARDLGGRLQWSVWDKEIVRKIATEYQLAETDVEAKDERVASFIERLVELLGLGGFTTAYSILPPRGLDDAKLLHMTRTIVEDIAQAGRAIIVSRGGNHILAKRPRTLHVFIFASLEARVQRVIQMENLTRFAAERRIGGMDRLRSDYVRAFYHADWRDPTHYHLTLDSAVWGEKGTADLILSALEQMPLQ
jgi:cytidylate kinase